MATQAIAVTNPSQTPGSGEVLVGAGDQHIVFPSGVDPTKIDQPKLYQALITLGNLFASPGFIKASGDSVVLTLTQDTTQR